MRSAVAAVTSHELIKVMFMFKMEWLYASKRCGTKFTHVDVAALFRLVWESCLPWGKWESTILAYSGLRASGVSQKQAIWSLNKVQTYVYLPLREARECAADVEHDALMECLLKWHVEGHIQQTAAAHASHLHGGFWEKHHVALLRIGKQCHIKDWHAHIDVYVRANADKNYFCGCASDEKGLEQQQQQQVEAGTESKTEFERRCKLLQFFYILQVQEELLNRKHSPRAVRALANEACLLFCSSSKIPSITALVGNTMHFIENERLLNSLREAEIDGIVSDSCVDKPV
jgi:hypothetical protein